MDERLIKELKNLINSSKGRAHTDRLVELLRAHPEWHKILIDIYLSDEEPVSRKIIWAIDLYADEDPTLVTPYLEAIADRLKTFRHNALKRHSLHLLSRFPLPARNLGKLVDICFTWLLDRNQDVSVKAYCMDILYRISLSESGLKQELADSIELRLAEETPGFQNRGRKILRKLSLVTGNKYN